MIQGVGVEQGGVGWAKTVSFQAYLLLHGVGVYFHVRTYLMLRHWVFL